MLKLSFLLGSVSQLTATDRLAQQAGLAALRASLTTMPETHLAAFDASQARTSGIAFGYHSYVFG